MESLVYVVMAFCFVFIVWPSSNQSIDNSMAKIYDELKCISSTLEKIEVIFRKSR